VFPSSLLSPIRESARQLNWTSLASGRGLVIEFAFLAPYRAAWNLASPAVASAAIALILIPLGNLVVPERLSTLNFCLGCCSA